MDAETYSKQAIAAAWATRNLSAQEWNNWCLKFVANAYGKEAAGYNTAAQAADALGVPNRPNRPGAYGFTEQQKRDILSKAKVGDLVFFEATEDNEAGHVGVYLGNGRMASATPSGVREEDVLGSVYNSARFRGVTSPPKEWQGKTLSPDLVAGAKKFQSVIESSSMASETTKTLKKQLDDESARVTALEAEKARLAPDLTSTDKTKKNAADARIQEINKELPSLKETVRQIEQKHSASVDNDTKVVNAPYTATTGTGQRAEDIALAGAALKLQEAQDAYNKENSPEGKAEAKLRLDAAQVSLDTARANLARIGQPAPRTPEQAAEDAIKLRVLQQMDREGVLVGTQKAELARLLALVPTQAEIEARGTNATNTAALSGVNLEKAQIEIQQIKDRIASGAAKAEDDARLRVLQAQVTATEATAGRAGRQNVAGGPLDIQQQLEIEQSQAAIDKARFEAAAREEEKKIIELYRTGAITKDEALIRQGKFLESIEAQLNDRRQAEIERATAEREAQEIEKHNLSLAEFASEQLSNMQGAAVIANRGSNVGDPNKPGATFNPGGDPNDTPANRVLGALGLSMRKPTPLVPITKPSSIIPPVAVTPGQPIGQGVAVPEQTPYTAPAFDYSAAGNAKRYGIGQPPVSFFNGGV